MKFSKSKASKRSRGDLDSDLNEGINDNKRMRYDDSSDEEEIEDRNQQYDLAKTFIRTNFEELSRDLRFKDIQAAKPMVSKSFLLHNIGRMAVYSPQVENKYRQYKQDALLSQDFSEDSRPTLDRDKKINIQENYNIVVSDIIDLLAVGRLLRRSQVRLSRNLGDTYDGDDQQTSATIAFSSKGQGRTKSNVEEKLIANSKGLAGRKPPYMDFVDLKLERGDYKSAYRGNQHNRGESSIDQVTQAGDGIIESESMEEEKSQELDGAIKVIRDLKGEISQHFPAANSDAFISDSIRKCCRGEPLLEIQGDQVMQDKIYALTYLLFKTEVYRTPAALISNIQMLDLIVNGEMTLEDAFNGKMPMSIGGAIKAGRSLNDKYNNQDSFYNFQNPYQYSSFGGPSKDKSLIILESDLMDKWLEFKLGNERFEEIKDNIEDHLPEICLEIYGSLQSFGLNIHSQALNRATTAKPKTRTQTTSVEQELLAEVPNPFVTDIKSSKCINPLDRNHCPIM